MRHPDLPPLPIDPLLPRIRDLLRAHPSLVIEAKPGAGKTTRVPPALLDAGLAGDHRQIAVLEPRRIAARLMARRVASERGETLGQSVGYQVRFDEAVGPSTRLCFFTEGLFVRRLIDDPDLSAFGVVILDEVHERHLETDLALALLRRLQRTSRPDLKLVVMSATLDTAALSAFLGAAPIVQAPGRPASIAIEHLARPDARPLEEQVASCLRRALDADPADTGDILVFLPGATEIRRSAATCAPIAERRGLSVHVLHGDLSAEAQDRVLAAGPERKLILSTNVAESSLTLEGVTCVIDSGLARVARCSAWSGIPTLRVERVSRASATQRSGRAGRVRDGRCYRLFDRHDFDTRPEHAAPELMRLDLAQTALLLHGLGIGRLGDVAWLDAPPQAACDAADALLRDLGAVGMDGALTALGRQMLGLPLHPRLARVMIEAASTGFPDEGALIAALLGERPIRRASRIAFGGQVGFERERATVASDVLDAADRFEQAARDGFSSRSLERLDLDAGVVHAVERVTRQLRRVKRERRLPAAKDEARRERALLRAILAGFPDRVAARRPSIGGQRSDELLLCGGGAARLSSESGVREAQLLVALDLEDQGRAMERKLRVRMASEIEPEWLIDLFPDKLREADEVRWNRDAERAETRGALFYDRLVLTESVGRGDPEREAACLAQAACEAGLARFIDTGALAALRVRVALLKEHLPELAAPALDEESIARFMEGACVGKRSFRELEEEPLLERLRVELLGPLAFRLDTLFPDRIELPGGRRVAVHYEPGQAPWIESRLQDFFGELTTPSLAQGRLPLVLHLLAPNGRAVQVTRDLRGFWERHYPELRPALARRYPRHAWPEDPRTARPPLPSRR
ncbi:MAG: ATP-dependent helicase HrpB [Myxococcales bacterium]|nr:ATP-dependent helicase HrpB [Myxococcales bacterium]